MDIDGMYENTPWERLALWAPWLGLGVVLAAIVLYRVAKGREAADSSGGGALRMIALMAGARGVALLTLGGLFVTQWRQAHDTYPRAFGRGAIGVAIGSVVLVLLVTLLRR